MRKKERFIPVQIDADICMRCERCLKACKNKAIVFDRGIRKVDYDKCKSCLVCVQVCPRNAIVVTSVESEQVLTIKIDHDKCTLCEECLSDYCPHDLFYKDKIKLGEKEIEIIKFKYNEVGRCRGCLKCQAQCPENAILPVIFNS